MATYDSKQINELSELNKLSGQEYVLIDTGSVTYKVRIDSLMGYIGNSVMSKINSAEPGSGNPFTSGGADIIVIPEDEEIPPESRIPGCYYLNIKERIETNFSNNSGGTTVVGGNMGLKVVEM